MIWEVPGLTVGHSTHAAARTGCTVVLVEPAAVASGEVRGSAPANREFSLLEPTATVERIDAVVLSGGSAFGLAAADGVVEFLEAHDRGFPTRWGRVPIVVAMSLFDLGVGDPSVRPGPEDGRVAAQEAARGATRTLGALGAGTGATVGKWRGEAAAVPGGLVGAVRREAGVVVACLVAVNAWGDVAGVGRFDEPPPDLVAEPPAPAANTTIGVVATDAPLDKLGCLHLARGAHDGLARAVDPPHATVDGDAFVALATGTARPERPVPLDLLRWMALGAVEDAIRSLGVAPGPR